MKPENLTKLTLSSQTQIREIINDDTFNYDGYQVVRGEFFAHTHEPAFTFNQNRVSLNMACIKKLPQFEYVQILVHPNEKKLAVRPCKEEERDSFRWCTKNPNKRSPKQITCKVFYAKIITLMGWNLNYRYKLLGKLICSNGELLFIFDLKTPEIFQRVIKDEIHQKNLLIPNYPESWKNQFGVSMEEHQKSLQVNIFDGYAIFNIKNNLKPSYSMPPINVPGSKEVTCE
ncbi:hypothetical protein LAD12857_19730 [Lacrimispora amygdalina]|uniref:Integrase n=1 Tax=Lacrimispora amygdalina TaxID=253257 RepID=A0ABQ5M689_9FIRM